MDFHKKSWPLTDAFQALTLHGPCLHARKQKRHRSGVLHLVVMSLMAPLVHHFHVSLVYDSISKVKASERHLSCLSCQWEGKKQRQQGRQGRQDVVEGWCDSCLNKLIDIQQFLYNHFKNMETWTRKQLNKYFHKVWELILLLKIFKIYLEGFVHYLKTQTRCWSYLK